MKILLSIAVFGLLFIGATQVSACGFWSPCPPPPTTSRDEAKTAIQIQKDIVASIPIPDLKTSSERANVAKRAVLFNNAEKISYIYLVSYGKVMAFYTVKGKVSSLRSYMTPTEKLVDAASNECSTEYRMDNGWKPCYPVSSADIDGTYGENVEGIFFFTTEDAYVEWKGEYMMSDQPLKLTTTPELVREIK